jgi:hypothetical protein
MEREAIRPNVLGKFSDLLVSIETHPAMLRYLDNAQSVGQESMVVQRGAKRNQPGHDAHRAEIGGQHRPGERSQPGQREQQTQEETERETPRAHVFPSGDKARRA